MKKSIVVGAMVAGIVASAAAQEFMIDSISGNGSMSFRGAQVGTTAAVEWAASLTDAGRTNWHALTNVLVTSEVMTNDIPMFFRVRGTPDTNTVAEGLLAFWRLDGNGVDSSTNGNDLTISNAVAVSDQWGSPNGAMEFDGVSAFGESAQFLPDTASFSCSAWIWITNHAPNQVILYDGDGTWGVRLSLVLNHPAFSNTSIFSTKTTPNEAMSFDNAEVPTNEWCHIVVVADSVGDKKQIWVNGKKIVEAAWSGTANFGHHHNVQLGRFHDGVTFGGGADGYFGGKIDQVRLYSRALTRTEVAVLYSIVP